MLEGLSESRASVTKKAWEQKNRDQRLPESKAYAKLQVLGTRKRGQKAVSEQNPCQLRWL